MFKKILIGIGIILILLTGAFFYIKKQFTPDADHIKDFILSNPERSAITLIQQDTILVQYNGDRLTPLASTVKLLFALK